MKIALIGADGQLGSDLTRMLKEDEVVPLFYPDFDITLAKSTKETLLKINPKVVINTAAYHKVDECEGNAAEAFSVNSTAVRELALICRELELVLVHFSTDYVFDGKKNSPYQEVDTPNPLSVYAVSKLSGEYFIRSLADKYFLIRTCGLYGEAGCWGKGTNFVDSMVLMNRKGNPLKVVNDQIVTPTSTLELAQRIVQLIQTNHYGLYHLTNEGSCNWFEFSEAIFDILRIKADITPVDSKTFGSRARRPSYSVLENKNAKKIGLSEFSHWKKALENYLIRKGYKKV